MIEKLTGRLRWVQLHDNTGSFGRSQLQQEWIDEEGKRTWQPVPVVERTPERIFE
jgi:hypothetical protein